MKETINKEQHTIHVVTPNSENSEGPKGERFELNLESEGRRIDIVFKTPGGKTFTAGELADVVDEVGETIRSLGDETPISHFEAHREKKSLKDTDEEDYPHGFQLAT